MATDKRCRFSLCVADRGLPYLQLCGDSHRDGGRAFLILRADPRTMRLYRSWRHLVIPPPIGGPGPRRWPTGLLPTLIRWRGR